jgi:hypothetical protein
VSEPQAVETPALRLGATTKDGIGASIYALVERGVGRHPLLASRIRSEVELRFAEEFAPVRMTFSDQGVVVEDGPAQSPDLRVTGRLPDIVALTTAPLLGGWPNPALRRGRAALARLANGRVRIAGDRDLAWQLLRLFEV